MIYVFFTKYSTRKNILSKLFQAGFTCPTTSPFTEVVARERMSEDQIGHQSSNLRYLLSCWSLRDAIDGDIAFRIGSPSPRSC